MKPWYSPDEWVFLVGGGPSLRGFDFAALARRAHIAINKAFLSCPRADAVYWGDGKFWNEHRDRLLDQRLVSGVRFALRDDVYRAVYPPHQVETMANGGMTGLSTRWPVIRHGNNSGYAAINLATLLGARRLCLLGYDMRLGPEGEDHWHDGYAEKIRAHTLECHMLPHFASLVEPLRQIGVEVVNASPESALPHWPKITPAEALQLRDGWPKVIPA